MSTIRVVDRTFAILEIIAHHPQGVGVNAIARAADLPNSTVSRILLTVEQWEAVVRTEDNLFQIGPGLVRLVGQQSFTQNLTALARPIMQDIAETTGEAIALCVLNNMQTYYLDHVQSSQTILVRDWTGEHLPLHVAAPGKVFLAYASPDFVESVLAKPLLQFAERTITAPERLRTHLTDIRTQGFAISDEEFAKGVLGLGVPIRDNDGNVMAAFNLYGPKFRLKDAFKQQQIVAVLQKGAKTLEEKYNTARPA
jgi:DNA-binding IclR family transcriptional regulator